MTKTKETELGTEQNRLTTQSLKAQRRDYPKTDITLPKISKRCPLALKNQQKSNGEGWVEAQEEDAELADGATQDKGGSKDETMVAGARQ